MEIIESDVVVVGAGPTGLMLAAELALAGVAVDVVEREAERSGQSRGGGVNQRTSEALAMRGLLDAASEQAIPQKSSGGHFAFLPVPLDTEPWRTRYPAGVLIPQDRLEAILQTRLLELGGRVRRGAELVGLTQDAEGVEAVAGGPGGELRLRGRYLVGCDGGHSTVRKITSAEFPGRAGTMAAVTADIDLASASETVPRAIGHIGGLVRTGEGYWMMLHPLDGEGGSVSGFRVVFGGPEQVSIPRTAPVTEDEVGKALTAVHGPETVLARVRWGTRFSDASRQLAEYRHGRVLFAGDAAHIHSPVGGQGLNLGIQDAMNLGWKLAATVRGDAPAGLLDTYHAERHPVGARVLATARAQTVIMNVAPDSDAGALREIVADLVRLPDGNRHITGLMSGLAIRYDLGDPDPLVGSRMVDISMETAEGPTTVSDLLRAGRGLLVRLGPPEKTTTLGRVDRVVGQVVDSPVGTDLGDADQLLVRPDGYVCWAGHGPDASPDAALRRWFGDAGPAGPLTLTMVQP